MTPATFFVSTGRTGTSFLAQLFESLGARSSHEPGPRWLRLLSNAHVAGRVGTPRAARVLTSVRRELLSGDGAVGQPYVESSCLVYGLVAPLLEAFPSAEVVHVVRDPRTYVQSGLSWGAYRAGGRMLNLLPYRRLAPPQFDPWSPSARVDWARQGQLERLCWAWTAMNRAMREQGEGSDRFRTVRFEDLFDESTAVPVLASLCGVVGVETPAPDRLALSTRTQVNASRERPSARWADWDEARRRHLAEACGEEAARYGYDLAPAAA